MYTAQLGLEHPIAIRYPRGRGVLIEWQKPFEKIKIGSLKELKKGTRVAVLSIGAIGNTVSNVINEMSTLDEIGHYDMRFVKPLDTNRLSKIFKTYKHIITIEDGCKSGGFGSAVLEFANETKTTIPIHIMGIDDDFIPHGTTEELHKIAGIDAASIKKTIEKFL